MVHTVRPSSSRAIRLLLGLVALGLLLAIAILAPTAQAQPAPADATAGTVASGARTLGLAAASRAIVAPEDIELPDEPDGFAPDPNEPDLPDDAFLAGDSSEPDDPDSLSDEAPEWDVLDPLEVPLPRVTSTLVSGTIARLRTDDRAAIPRAVPKRVRALIAQINKIIGKRSRRGGGHATLVDRGYDSAGAISYGLVRAGLLRRPLVSGRFAHWAQPGVGRWVTVYASRSHVYMEVAGMRLDTSTVGDDPSRTGVRWRPAIGKRAGFKVRHPAGL